MQIDHNTNLLKLTGSVELEFSPHVLFLGASVLDGRSTTVDIGLQVQLERGCFEGDDVATRALRLAHTTLHANDALPSRDYSQARVSSSQVKPPPAVDRSQTAADSIRRKEKSSVSKANSQRTNGKRTTGSRSSGAKDDLDGFMVSGEKMR